MGSFGIAILAFLIIDQASGLKMRVENMLQIERQDAPKRPMHPSEREKPLFKKIQLDLRIVPDNWKDRMLKCSEDSPWSGLRSIASKTFGSSNYVGNHLVNQIEERLATEGRPINQGGEGFCGLVSLEYILIGAQPELFATVIADIFCTGATAAFGKQIEVQEAALKCTTSSSSRRDSLYYMEDEGNGIAAVDFLFAATFGAIPNLFTKTCASQQGQSQGPSQITDLAKLIFPRAQVNLIGGIPRHALNLVKRGFGVWDLATHVSESEWRETLTLVKMGGQALLTIDTNGGGELHGFTNHWIVLTRILDGVDTIKACPKQILKDRPACVIWTWARYYVFEDCENLRKMTADIVNIMDVNRLLPGPDWFLPGSQPFEHTLYKIHRMQTLRLKNQVPRHSLSLAWRVRAEDIATTDGGARFVPRVLQTPAEVQKGYELEDIQECRKWPNPL